MRQAGTAQIYKKDRSLRAGAAPPRHTKMDSTVRILGIELEDALMIAEAREI